MRALGLSVVVPTLGRETLCRDAIGSVVSMAGRTGLDIELIVVEQGDRPGYAIAPDFDGTWLFSRTRGASFARNVGLERATRPTVLFLDDDGVAVDGIADLVAAREESGAAMVCGRMTTPEGEVARGGDRAGEVSSINAFRFFVEGSAVWDRERLLAIGGFDERLGPPNRFGAEEGAEALARLLRDGGEGRYLPVDALVHPALDRAPADKAFRYGRGTAGIAWAGPSTWTFVYAAASAVRRTGGALRALVRRDRDGFEHRACWLGGFAFGVLTGWRLRRRPNRLAERELIERR